MLHDPKWHDDSTQDRISRLLRIEPMIAWAKTKDPNEEFEWSSSLDCFLGQYFRAHGIDVVVSSRWLRGCYIFDGTCDIPYTIQEIVKGGLSGDDLEKRRFLLTFGEVLACAQSCLTTQESIL